MAEMTHRSTEAASGVPVPGRGRQSALTGISGLALALLLGGLLAGCETGRTNKAHAEWQHLSDDTTTSKPESTQALSPGEHQPPVPGSPTAAGADGNQPMDDMEAQPRHGNEHGKAAAPHAQPAGTLDRH